MEGQEAEFVEELSDEALDRLPIVAWTSGTPQVLGPKKDRRCAKAGAKAVTDKIARQAAPSDDGLLAEVLDGAAAAAQLSRAGEHALSL
jgi:hypothetical protein